ncbi:MAG: glutamine--fructose-6-phosphate transaminase (isomerizing) [Thaumarchaeota archaeon]|nr:MAG: glutamine--fructose-6-phosphate transaminase (isomerizing) [Nitrososphaerota archaeon]
MCGIIGYIGNRRAAPILLKGLKHLEYRGYDSAGMATLSSRVEVRKDVGKIEDLEKRLRFEEMEGEVGIGHTRWATHGKVTKENAHPHFSQNRKIYVVHNGIIENYQELREFLKENGFNFYSETDTEVIPNLIQYEMERGKNFEEACKAALKRLEGSFAVVIMHEGEEKLIAARRGSPLVIGVGDGEYFVASDIPAFLEFTKKVIFMYDWDFAVITKNGVKFYNLREGKEVERSIDVIDWDAEQAKKGEFKHYMIKEILEQVETIQRAAMQDESIVAAIVEEMRKARGIFFVGCGSSYHACFAGSYIFSKVANLHVNVMLASEFPNFKHFLNENTLVFAVSQSGETADVLEAVRAAKEKGSKVISITNVRGSSITRYSDRFLLLNAGPEICVLATKTYTSQLALLTLLAYAYAGRYEEGRKRLRYLWNVVYNLTSRTSREMIKKLAERLKDEEHIFVIGRGLQYATALEAALKIKEVSYIHAEAFAGGELKHGTIALIEDGTPCIVFVSEENEKEIISNAVEIKSRGGYIIGVSPKNNDVFDFWIKVPECDVANPIVQIIPIQILAYQLAVLRGYDPDKPRNLAKSVTVK